jgi:hypothetical protein
MYGTKKCKFRAQFRKLHKKLYYLIVQKYGVRSKGEPPYNFLCQDYILKDY